MTLAAKAMVEYVFYRLGVDRIESSTFGWNAASRRVLESAGFAYEGRLVDAVVKDGRATDQLLFGLDRDAR
jgi:RimJ/RimL family protein N-acetyltransferase